MYVCMYSAIYIYIVQYRKYTYYIALPSVDMTKSKDCAGNVVGLGNYLCPI